MLAALLDGRALTAIELAYAARITPQTASFHLAKLIEAGLLTATKNGRHRYFRLESPKVFEMRDSIMTVAIANKPKFSPLSREDEELSEARICYDNLAGRLSVDITDFFTARSYISLGKRIARLTSTGTRFLAEFGVNLSSSNSGRRGFCQLCLDWTERRSHADSDDAGRAFRLMSATCSDRSRPAVPIEVAGVAGRPLV